MSASSVGKDDLPRALELFGAVTIVVGVTIGSGLFRSAAGFDGRLPGPGAMLLVWVAGGILATCGALALAEIASSDPTGGISVCLREGSGRVSAFLFGWAELVILRAVAIGALAVVSVVWAFDGWADLTSTGGEVKNGERTLQVDGGRRLHCDPRWHSRLLRDRRATSGAFGRSTDSSGRNGMSETA